MNLGKSLEDELKSELGTKDYPTNLMPNRVTENTKNRLILHSRPGINFFITVKEFIDEAGKIISRK